MILYNKEIADLICTYFGYEQEDIDNMEKDFTVLVMNTSIDMIVKYIEDNNLGNELTEFERLLKVINTNNKTEVTDLVNLYTFLFTLPSKFPDLNKNLNAKLEELYQGAYMVLLQNINDDHVKSEIMQIVEKEMMIFNKFENFVKNNPQLTNTSNIEA